MKKYETEIVEIGKLAFDFLKENMMILFGRGAPESLYDYCFIINKSEVNGEILAGDQLWIDNDRYLITSVGDVVSKNLNDLAHITLNFNAKPDAVLGGTIYLNKRNESKFAIGTKLVIESGA